jgi:hypothetical protein
MPTRWNRLWTCPMFENMSQSDLGHVVVNPVFSSLYHMTQDNCEGCAGCDNADVCDGPVEYAPIIDGPGMDIDEEEP